MYDIPTLLVGTLMVAGIAMLVAAPIGLGAAIYLSEYARPRVRSVLKPILEVLASIPSVVLGFSPSAFITPNSSSSSSRADMRSTCRRRRRGRHPDHPAGGVHLRGRHAGRAATLREASSGLGARVTSTLRVVVPGRGLGHRGRADRRLRGRSARRWWSPSPPAVWAAAFFTRTCSSRARP